MDYQSSSLGSWQEQLLTLEKFTRNSVNILSMSHLFITMVSYLLHLILNSYTKEHLVLLCCNVHEDQSR